MSRAARFARMLTSAFRTTGTIRRADAPCNRFRPSFQVLDDRITPTALATIIALSDLEEGGGYVDAFEVRVTGATESGEVLVNFGGTAMGGTDYDYASNLFAYGA